MKTNRLWGRFVPFLCCLSTLFLIHLTIYFTSFYVYIGNTIQFQARKRTAAIGWKAEKWRADSCPDNIYSNHAIGYEPGVAGFPRRYLSRNLILSNVKKSNYMKSSRNRRQTSELELIISFMIKI